MTKPLLQRATGYHPRGSRSPADVCLIVEGTYPYTRGGVSSWTHDLIRNQPERTFHLVTLVASSTVRKLSFELPKNVVGFSTIELQTLKPGRRSTASDSGLLESLRPLLATIVKEADIEGFKELLRFLQPIRGELGYRVLFESRAAWKLVQNMYQERFRAGPFLDYFWTWRSIFGSLFSVLCADIPKCSVYHALCTGYAGLFGARASLETGKPLVLTEHGIYTSERRLELGMAQWCHDIDPTNLSVRPHHVELRHIWEEAFASYSRITYGVSRQIITLFEENQRVQRSEGAEISKQAIIPNGIDFPRFSGIRRKTGHLPTVALIGRVVPIKGVTLFIQVCSAIRAQLPEFRALIMGPCDEDEGYANECRVLVQRLGLQKNIQFTGSVEVADYLGEIDVLALTSLSEAQPLVILEAGAAGVPCVATDVGACREVIFGRPDERPSFGSGGGIVGPADAIGAAERIVELLRDRTLRDMCGDSLKRRVRAFYDSQMQHTAYRFLYRSYLREIAGETNAEDSMQKKHAV